MSISRRELLLGFTGAAIGGTGYFLRDRSARIESDIAAHMTPKKARDRAQKAQAVETGFGVVLGGLAGSALAGGLSAYDRLRAQPEPEPQPEPGPQI